MAAPSITSVSARPHRLHHAAWVTRDQEATRQFYEDIIGLPLVATWAEKRGDGSAYCHTFFALADGGALAFFQYADQDEQPVDLKSPGHLAFECDQATQEGIRQRLDAAGYTPRITDHGYCISLYVNDPNDLRLEFTVDHPEMDRINAEHQADPHTTLRRWLAGDHTPNNDIRPH